MEAGASSGYLLQTPQPWRECDARLTVFAAMPGLIRMTAFGIYGRSRRRAALLQPFRQLHLEWTDNDHGSTLRDVTVEHGHRFKTLHQTACASYVNELVSYCAQGVEGDGGSQLLAAMSCVFCSLQGSSDLVSIARHLRIFEHKLLALCGYNVYASDAPLADRKCYRYCLRGGWIEDFRGLCSQTIRRLGQEGERVFFHSDADIVRRAQYVQGALIRALLGDGAIFHSRRFLRAYQGQDVVAGGQREAAANAFIGAPRGRSYDRG